MSANAVVAIMMKDETDNSTAHLHYEYQQITDIENAFSSMSRFEKHGQGILDMLNKMGEQGWDLYIIGEDDCIMQRIKEKTDVKYEYNIVPMQGVSKVKKLFNNLGEQGWDYCLWAVVMHTGYNTPPMIMKRNMSLEQKFEYNFKFIPQISLFEGKSYDRSFKEMQKAFQDPLVKGWKFKNGLVIDEKFCGFNDKIFFVFQVDKDCK